MLSEPDANDGIPSGVLHYNLTTCFGATLQISLFSNIPTELEEASVLYFINGVKRPWQVVAKWPRKSCHMAELIWGIYWGKGKKRHKVAYGIKKCRKRGREGKQAGVGQACLNAKIPPFCLLSKGKELGLAGGSE